MILLLDIGNTHTHLGLANDERVLRQMSVATSGWFDDGMAGAVEGFAPRRKLQGACFCSVVPKATARCRKFLGKLKVEQIELTSQTARGIGIKYPKPETIGADRLANAVAVNAFFGAPSVVVDFGTAVTFDVVNARSEYVGGIIAPGLSAMTDYLHEKTALLPRIEIREPRGVIGRNTEQAMLIGAVHGYRGLVRGLIAELKAELKTRRLPVVATGGYAKLIAEKLPELTAVEPNLTLEGLRLVWLAHARPSRATTR